MTQAFQVRRDQQDIKVLKDLQDLQEQEDLLATPVTLAAEDTPVLRVLQDRKEHWDQWGQLDRWVRMDHQGHQVPLDPSGRQDQTVSKVTPAQRVQLVLLALLVSLDRRVTKVFKVELVIPEELAILDQPGRRDIPELRDKLDSKA